MAAPAASVPVTRALSFRHLMERKAISRELHDAVGQSLSAVLFELRNLSAMLPADDKALKEPVEAAQRLVEGSVGMVRNMALLLRPSMLDDLGLLPAVEWHARDKAGRLFWTEISVRRARIGGEDTFCSPMGYLAMAVGF